MSPSAARLTAVSGGIGKTPACFLVETGRVRLLLDMGLGPPPGLLPDVSNVGRVDALVLSHGHRDHIGGMHLRAQVGNPPVFAPASIMRFLPADISARPLPLGGRADVLGVPVSTGRNGHSPGGAWLHLDVGDGLVYMADYSVESLIYAYDPPPAAATLVLDASDGTGDEPLTQCMERLQPVLARESALFPIPVDGRGPEIACHVARTQPGLPCIADDLRAGLQRIAVENAASLREGVADELIRIARDAPPIDSPRGLLFAAVADGTRGESARLLGMWESQPDPEIVFTGYLTPGTPAERLTKTGRAQYAKWNVHPRLSDNIALVRTVGARQVLAAFCPPEDLERLAAVFAPAALVGNATCRL
jgi:Cft2 family RNA processing exonuclease